MLLSIISLSKQLISIPSDPGNTRALHKALDVALYRLQHYTIEEFEHNGVRSALVYNTPHRPKKFSLIFNGHLDVIPGKKEQYTPRIQGNRLYGVGAMDMKANLACMILAFRDVAHQLDHPVALQLVTDEEVGGFDGTKYQIEQGVDAKFVLAGEPTNFDIVHEAKGVVWLKLSTHGKTAHGAYPWRGRNAIWLMNDVLNILKKYYPIPQSQQWITTLTVARIETANQAFNKIPDDCVIGLDIRTIPTDHRTIIKHIKSLLPRGVRVETAANESPLVTDPTHPAIQQLQHITKQNRRKSFSLRSAQGSSDARHFARVHCPGIEFGPMGDGIGSDNEWVSIPSLAQYYTILTQFLRAQSSSLSKNTKM